MRDCARREEARKRKTGSHRSIRMGVSSTGDPIFGWRRPLGVTFPAAMIELHTLGALDLRAVDGQEVRAVLQQPKRLALLAYLAADAPRRFHRRDSLLALFWPDLDQGHARAALRRALHFLAERARRGCARRPRRRGGRGAGRGALVRQYRAGAGAPGRRSGAGDRCSTAGRSWKDSTSRARRASSRTGSTGSGTGCGAGRRRPPRC